MATRSGTAMVSLPPWLWDSDPATFLGRAELDGQHVADGWLVQARPVPPRGYAALVRAVDLAGPGVPTPRFGDLGGYERAALTVDRDRDFTTARARLERRAEHGNQIGDPAAQFDLYRLVLSTAPRTEAPAAAEAVYDSLRDTRSLEDEAMRFFEHAGAHFITRRDALHHRAMLAPVLLRLDQDPRLSSGDPSSLAAIAAAGEHVFASATELLSGAVLLDAYLGPLFGALSPSVWAFAAHRSSGVLVYTLGQPVAGTTGHAAELLQALSLPGPTDETPVPALSPDASRTAVTWWSRRLAALFGTLTDPAVFADSDGRYLPYRHLHAFLNAEQLFRRVTSIQASWRDANARRVLLFTVLDTLIDGLYASRSFTELCSLPFARNTLTRLRGRVPADAAEVLLPGAERAVTALERLQDGFFLQRQSRTEQVELLHPDGTAERIWPDDAAAAYLKVLRNATHGHGSNRPEQVARTNALLAHHTGHVPHDLALLGYLYLLELLSDTALLRSSLRQRARR